MEKIVSLSANLSKPEILIMLARVPIFTGIGFTEQSILADHFDIENYGPGEILIEQDAIGDKLYVIVQGSVEVSIRTSSGWKRVNILGRGEVIGEIAILRNVPRTARITTISECQFLAICAQEFLKVYQYFTPSARDNIQLIITKRLQELADYRH